MRSQRAWTQICRDGSVRARPASDTYPVPDSGLGHRAPRDGSGALDVDSQPLARWFHGDQLRHHRASQYSAWEGPAADAASMRSDRDQVQVLGLVDRLHEASTIARTGAADLAAAKSRTMASVDNAHRAGFVVSEDLSVRDPLTLHSKPLRLIRDTQAQAFAADIRAQSTILAATHQSVASRLSTITAGFTGSDFRESPLPQEPPPPQIPFPPYEPKVWGAWQGRAELTRARWSVHLQPGTG